MLRNSKTRQPVLLALTLFLALSTLLSACGGASKGTSDKPSDANTTASPDAASGSKTDDSALPEVKLIWYVIGSFPQSDQAEVFNEVNKIVKEKINATIDFRTQDYGNYDQKMQVVTASGEPYDLAFTSNWTNNYAQNVAKGAFLPLDDLLIEYAPKSYANVPQEFWDAAKVNGKIYGFINQQISARTPRIAIPKALVEKYGFDLNSINGKITGTTFNLLEPFVQTVRKDDPRKVPFTDMNDFADAFDFEPIAGFNVPGVVAYDDDSLTVFNQFESEEIKTFAATMRDWNAKGYLDAETRVTKKADLDTDMKGGKMLFSIAGAYKPGGEFSDSLHFGEDVLEVPASRAHLTTGGIIATMTGISRTSKNPERAMMLLELLNTDKELFNLLNFGIKGKHFDLDADGFMIPGPGQNGYNPQVAWMFASNYLAYPTKGMPITVWEDTKKLNADAIPSKLLGFSFDAEPVKAEIAKTSAVYDEYQRAISLGVSTESKYDGFVEKLKVAGSDKIIAEMQKQIDAWKATK